LVEVLVVLAVAGIVAILALKSLGGGGKDQSLVNAQREFLTALRGAQNRVANGASPGGLEKVVFNVNSAYTVNGTPVSLPVGITITNSLPLTICFASRLLITPYVSGQCGSCVGSFFACENGANKANGSLNVTFFSGSTQKSVVIEGSGMTINRVYAQ
jgi:type II secretory pathway pseudopilin PulG